MKFRDFLDVRLICETGSLRKAAEVLGIAQPTLTTRIQHLEDQLGTPLFDRSRGRSVPTDLARFISRRTALMADEVDRLASEVARLNSGKEGLVRIGLGPAITRVLVGQLAKAIKSRSPGITLQIVSGPTQQLAEALIRRELDLLVSEQPDITHDALTSTSMLESVMVAVARPDHPMHVAPPVDLMGLLKYPIATSFIRQPLLATLQRDYGIDLESLPGRVVCSDFEMVVRVVAASPMLFTVGPLFTYAPELASGALAVVGTPLPFKHSVCIHTNADAYPLPAVHTARQVIGQLLDDMRAANG